MGPFQKQTMTYGAVKDNRYDSRQAPYSSGYSRSWDNNDQQARYRTREVSDLGSWARRDDWKNDGNRFGDKGRGKGGKSKKEDMTKEELDEQLASYFGRSVTVDRHKSQLDSELDSYFKGNDKEKNEKKSKLDSDLDAYFRKK